MQGNEVIRAKIHTKGRRLLIEGMWYSPIFFEGISHYIFKRTDEYAIAVFRCWPHVGTLISGPLALCFSSDPKYQKKEEQADYRFCSVADAQNARDHFNHLIATINEEAKAIREECEEQSIPKKLHDHLMVSVPDCTHSLVKQDMAEKNVPISFTINGKRKYMRLGRISKSDREMIQMFIRKIVKARELGIAYSPDVVAWLAWISPTLTKRLVNNGVLPAGH